MNKRGLTLVEALIGVAILQVAIFAAMYANQTLTQGNRATGDKLNYSLFRNQIFLFLGNSLVWKYTLEGAKNVDMACWLKQADKSTLNRNCNRKSGDLVVYNIKGTPEYDFSATGAGLSSGGGACSSFVAPPKPGNGTCPMGFKLTWEAVCEAPDTDCTAPLIKIDGKFTFNGSPQQDAPADFRLNFTTYRYMRYCPAQAPTTWTLVDGGVAPATTVTGGTQVMSGNTGKTFGTGYGVMANAGTRVLYVPCRTVTINYSEDMSTAPPAPLLVTDFENQSLVCLYDTDKNSCRFEVIRDFFGTSNRFRLRYQGTDVFFKPASLNISTATAFQIRVNRNLVEFLVDGRVYFTWLDKLTYPFEVRFRPASQSYSANGFYNVQVNTAN